MMRGFSGKRKYAFRKYSAAPMFLFKRERRRLLLHLSNAHIEHIGSTAVPGLGGKNILDIIVGVRGRSSDSARLALERLGYTFVPESGEPPRRLFLFRDAIYKGRHIRIHLHLVHYGSRDWNERVAFRDYLRTHSDAVLEYARVKRRAAKLAAGDKEKYMTLKDAYIRRTTRKAMRTKCYRP